jgi:choline dehydrogenase
MLSGIGPASVLAGLGLHVQHDSPDVGGNLQDHPVLPMIFRTRSTDTLKRDESPLNLLRYLLFKRGMLASNGVEGFAFSQVHAGAVSAPDLEFMFLPFEGRKEFLEPPQEHAFGLAPAVVAPRSRGRLTLRSAMRTSGPPTPRAGRAPERTTVLMDFCRRNSWPRPALAA